MRRLNLTILLIIIVLNSCNRYYLVESSDPVKYSSIDFVSSLESEYNTDFVAPYNYFLLRKKKNFGQSNYGIVYGDKVGYISSSNGFTLSRHISKKRYKRVYGASFLAYERKSNEVKSAYFQKKKAEDDNAYDTRSSGSADTYTPGTGGPVNVQGYYRKNGTYVRPHTRSAPSRRR